MVNLYAFKLLSGEIYNLKFMNAECIICKCFMHVMGFVCDYNLKVVCG